jgi:hypothetical protein
MGRSAGVDVRRREEIETVSHHILVVVSFSDADSRAVGGRKRRAFDGRSAGAARGRVETFQPVFRHVEDIRDANGEKKLRETLRAAAI